MTPLLLITGFLGAGKTTLLADLLPRLAAQGLAPHVILNDFQNALVDAARLRDLTGLVIPVSGSCVCCGSRDELLDALVGVPTEPGHLVLIEANGTADTEELLEMLGADPRARPFGPPRQVVVVDLQRWQRRHWNNEIERRQVRTATHVVYSRDAEVDADRRRAVAADLASCNARLVSTDAGGLALALRNWTATPAASDAPASPRAGTRTPADHARHHVAAWDCPLPVRVERDRLLAFLRDLPAEVVRAKGVAFLADNEAVLFQRVEDAEGISLLQLGDPSGLHPLAIFIGPGLDTRDLAARVRGLDERGAPA